MNFEIKHRFSGAVLFTLETESMKLCVEAAVKAGSDLRDANLGDAYLRGANLRGANLRGANLRGSDLRGSDLRGSDLRGANLRDANLRGANLGCSDLRDANLGGANLRDAYLRGANLGCSDLRDANLGGANLRDANGKEIRVIGERPLLTFGPLGSRADYLQAWLTDAGVYVRAGCFWGALDAFISAVTATHGDGIHAQEYAAAIALIETHAKLWTPKETI